MLRTNHSDSHFNAPGRCRRIAALARPAIAVLSAAALAGCSIEDTPPQSQIDRLRVLSVRIEGPGAPGEGLAELAPGEEGTLTPLVLAPGMSGGPAYDMTTAQSACVRGGKPSWDRDASGACAGGSVERKVYRFWFWCRPQAQTLSDDPCTSSDVLAKPGGILSTAGIEPLGPSCASPPAAPVPTPTACVQPPADLFAGEPSDALVRRRGVLMNVLLLAAVDVDGDLDQGRSSEFLDKVKADRVPTVLALKRVSVLDQPTNHNPAPSDIVGASGPILDGARLGEDHSLVVTFPEGDPRESYEQVSADGTVTARVERLDVAWLSGFGRFDDEHTLFGDKNTFTPAEGDGIDQPPPAPPGAGDYSMPFAVVVRDGRGGEGWLVRTVTVARPGGK